MKLKFQLPCFGCSTRQLPHQLPWQGHAGNLRHDVDVAPPPLRAIASFVSSILLIFVLSGCTTRKADGSLRRHYFGYTVVTIPKSAPVRADFCVRDVSNFGLAAGGGAVGLGYNQTKEVSLPPEGAIYIEVTTDAQFELARKLIETCPNICITQKRTTHTNAIVKP